MFEFNIQYSILVPIVKRVKADVVTHEISGVSGVLGVRQLFGSAEPYCDVT